MNDPIARDDPKLGQVLNGTYRLESILGTGGMGTVYLATHIHLATQFAVKSLVPQFIENPEAIKRFQREAQIASQLGHPNIVKVSDFNYDQNGVPFMVMDLLRGETLRARIQRATRLGLHESLPIVRQMCDGLAAAHAQGVVHRDLKPENIFLCEGGDQVKILDFGVSKIKNYKTQLTRPMSMLGTPFYMSPEQAMGNTADVDMLSDVWAVGALVYEMLTGEGAFQAENPVAVFYKIVNDPFPTVGSKVAGVTRAVDYVLGRACAKKPIERFQSTTEFARELELAASTTSESPMSVADAQAILSGGKVRRATAEDPTGHAPLPAQETKLIAMESDGRPPLAAESTRLLAPSDKPLPQQETRLNISLPDERAPLPAESTRLLAPQSPIVKSLGHDLANESTMIADQSAAQPLLGDDDEKTSVTGARSAAPAKTGEETAQVVMPAPGAPVPQRPAPRPVVLQAPTPFVTSSNTTPIAAGESVSPSSTMIRPPRKKPRWQLAAIGLGLGLSVAAVSGIVISNRHQVEQARLTVDEAIADRKWDDAEKALRMLRARVGDSNEMTTLATKIASERRAAEALRLAREMRGRGDGAGAYAELVLIDDKSVYAPEAARERSAVIRGYEEELEHDLAEHHCKEALTAARRLAALDPHRPIPPEVGSCGRPVEQSPDKVNNADAEHAYKQRNFERALAIAQVLVKESAGDDAAWRTLGMSACQLGNGDEARRARGHVGKNEQKALDKLCRAHRVNIAPPRETSAPAEPALEQSGMAARDNMTKMLASADNYAKRCFTKQPSYRAQMKLRVTAFPGSDHFVATAISTGPAEIRSCLEALFKNVTPPRVTAAVSAERIYSPDEE
jgi:serine/threonine-protein kinase